MSNADRHEVEWDGLARVLRHPLRQRLLFEYGEGTVSPSRLAATLNEPLNVVSYHTNVLRDAGCLELVRSERRRGATEHFYRSIVPGQIDDSEWQRVPVRLRRVLVRSNIDAAFREAADALALGGMDEPSSHVSRAWLHLDGEAIAALSNVLRSAFDSAIEIDAASRRRGLAGAVPYELVIMSFGRGSRP